VCCGTFVPILNKAYNLRQASILTTDEIATAMNVVAHFGFGGKLAIRFLEASLLYFEDHIDDISDISSIKAVTAIAAFSLAGNFSYILFFLFRKIATSCGWERDHKRVFTLWLCQMLQFPYLDYDLPPTCVHECLRTWCLSRGGYVITPFQQEVDEVSRMLKALGISHRQGKIVNLPYALDIAIEKSRLAILVVAECSRNTREPSGVSVLNFNHIRLCGWNPIAIHRAHWKSMSFQERQALVNDILEEAGLVPQSFHEVSNIQSIESQFSGKDPNVQLLN